MADFDPANQAALKTELTTDPKGLGLGAMTDTAAAAKLNQAGASSETLPNRVLESFEFMRCVKMSEFDAVFSTWTAGQKEWFARLVSTGKVDVGNTQVKTDLVTLFPAGTAAVTRAAVLAVTTRTASRAEVLFGAGVIIQYFDVARARAS